MYALSFDMTIADLQEHYGNPYHGAYFEIKRTLVKHGFYWVQGSTYMTNADNLLNLSRLLDRPKALQDRVFDRLFEQAEIAKYSPEERREYEVSVKNYWDYNSTMRTAATNASNERAKTIAQNLKVMNVMTAEQIAEATGLTTGEVERL